MPIFFANYCERINEYLAEYIEYIRYVCHKRQFLKNSWEDMESFITLELIKIYHKRSKYDDFDWVVRSVIRRKALDFSAYYIRRNKDLIFENQINDKDSNEKTRYLIYSEKSEEHFNKSEQIKKVLELVYDIQEKITNKMKFYLYFTDWDREYIEVILELYNLGLEVERDDIMECMGYEKEEISSFNSRLISFRNRLQKYLDLNVDMKGL